MSKNYTRIIKNIKDDNMIIDILVCVICWMISASAITLSVYSTIETWDCYKTNFQKVKSVAMSIIALVLLLLCMLNKFCQWWDLI